MAYLLIYGRPLRLLRGDDIAPNLSVQVTARTEPLGKYILNLKFIELLKLVESLAAPDFFVGSME